MGDEPGHSYQEGSAGSSACKTRRTASHVFPHPVSLTRLHSHPERQRRARTVTVQSSSSATSFTLRSLSRFRLKQNDRSLLRHANLRVRRTLARGKARRQTSMQLLLAIPSARECRHSRCGTAYYLRILEAPSPPVPPILPIQRLSLSSTHTLSYLPVHGRNKPRMRSTRQMRRRRFAERRGKASISDTTYSQRASVRSAASLSSPPLIDLAPHPWSIGGEDSKSPC